MGGVRQYSGRMDIDLLGFSRCKFPSEYALSAEIGQARSVNLGESNLLPHLDARFAPYVSRILRVGLMGRWDEVFP